MSTCSHLKKKRKNISKNSGGKIEGEKKIREKNGEIKKNKKKSSKSSKSSTPLTPSNVSTFSPSLTPEDPLPPPLPPLPPPLTKKLLAMVRCISPMASCALRLCSGSGDPFPLSPPTLSVDNSRIMGRRRGWYKGPPEAPIPPIDVDIMGTCSCCFWLEYS